MWHDKKARAEYLSREMALHDEATRIEEALEEGKALGKEIGKEEEKIAIAKSLLDVLDDETIAAKVELDVEIIKKMREGNS